MTLRKANTVHPVTALQSEYSLRVKYLEANAAAVDVHLSKEDTARIEQILKKYPNVGPRYSAKLQSFVKK
ncbi:MAG: hypothetical protein ACM3S2_14975 [Ignavibacteriales bacterium]